MSENAKGEKKKKKERKEGQPWWLHTVLQSSQGLTVAQYARPKQHRNWLQRMTQVKSWPHVAWPVEITASSAVNIDFAEPVFTSGASWRSLVAIHLWFRPISLVLRDVCNSLRIQGCLYDLSHSAELWLRSRDVAVGTWSAAKKECITQTWSSERETQDVLLSRLAVQYGGNWNPNTPGEKRLLLNQSMNKHEMLR